MASFFFIAVYLHISRGLYYGSYRSPRIGVWVIGTIIFFLMMATWWPKRMLINNIKLSYLYFNENLPFNKARTKALFRVGPHNIDGLSVLICGIKTFLKNPIDNFLGIFKTEISNLYIFNPEQQRKRLKSFEKERMSLPNNLQDILIGLFLGDICAQKRSKKGNTNLHFEQGLVHKEYTFHLFDLFKDFCRSGPKITERTPDKRTGKVYTRVCFTTYSLPCFNEFYYNFYSKGKKIVPLNIEELLTPLGLVYWISDDGTYCKKHKYIRIATNSYSLQEVHLLLNVLRNKFNLTCYPIQDRTGYVITIAAKSVIYLQPILKPFMPFMLLHKIGL